MNVKLLVALFVLFIPSAQDNCGGRCDCSDWPLTESFCVQCCFTQKGTVTSTSPSSVTITPAPSPLEPKPAPKTFKIDPRTKIEKSLETGKEATVYYHDVDGQKVATKIDLTDYIQGQLTPDSLPDPPDNECVKSHSFPLPSAPPPGAMKVLFGTSGSIGFSNPYVALQVDKEDIITLQRTRQGLLFSAKLYDSEGKLAAQIIDNHFFVKVRTALRLDQKSMAMGTSRVYARLVAVSEFP